MDHPTNKDIAGCSPTQGALYVISTALGESEQSRFTLHELGEYEFCNPHSQRETGRPCLRQSQTRTHTVTYAATEVVAAEIPGEAPNESVRFAIRLVH